MDERKQNALLKKENALYHLIERYGNLAVAFSGGIDSTVLLAAAKRQLGNQVVAFTAASNIHPEGELEAAVEMAKMLGVQHIVIETHELEDPAFVTNPVDRCYYCKRAIFSAIRDRASDMGIQFIAHGANLDDVSDVRPGFRAAGELSIEAPLIDAVLGKEAIRQLARQWGLPNWDRPAMACLATRIPYGTKIKAEVLRRIDRAETLIRSLGVKQCRVRHYGDMARIESDEETIAHLANPQFRSEVVAGLRSLGYQHICLDLEGYVPGKMNRCGNLPEI